MNWLSWHLAQMRWTANVHAASAIEARRAETPKSGSVEDESAVAKPDAKKRSA